MRDAAAAAAKCIRRAQHHWIANRIGKRHAILDILNDKRRRAGLANLFHRVLEFLPVLRFSDCGGGCAKELYIMRSQKSALLQLHAKIEPCLTAQRWQYRIWFFLLNNLL